jgi:hypothetical protein
MTRTYVKKTNSTYMRAEHRRAQIDAVAMRLSMGGGLYSWGLLDVARTIGMTEAGVRRYYTSALMLREKVIDVAVTERNLEIVTQALAMHDPLVADIPEDLRKACARYMARG